MLTRRDLIAALPALPEVTTPTLPDDRFRESLARVQEAEATLRQAIGVYESLREAIWLGMSRNERPARLRVTWRNRQAARAEVEAARRELAEAERRCSEAERLAGEG
jgi:hypothetical protein